MAHLFLAISVFLATHLVPSLPGVRAGLISAVGTRAYIAGYGLVSLITLIWVIVAMLQAPVVLLWAPTGWQAVVTIVLSPLALFLIITGAMSDNPLSLSCRKAADAKPAAIVSVTRHPIFWGAALWSASHIPPNGDTRSLLLFGTLSILAVSGFWLGDRRAKRRLGERWEEMAEHTSVIPFAAVLSRKTSLRLDRELLIAMALTAILTAWLLAGGHAHLFGADPLGALYY